MDFTFYRKVTVCLCVILHPIIGQTCSNISFPDVPVIPEATRPGTVILVVNVTDSATDQWNMSSPNAPFRLSYSSGIYNLSLTTSVTVECQKEKSIKLHFSCGVQNQSTTISVRYTDRYPPVWITSKVKRNLTVLESELPGTVVLDLNGTVQDQDCYHDGNVIEVVPYKVVVQLDASEYFAYNATSKQVSLSHGFDYDKRYCEPLFKTVQGAFFFQLIVYPEDNHQPSAQLKITATFKDVDDEPPIFLKSKDCTRCISICKSTSQSHTIHLENGIQKNCSFDVIAKDFDTADDDLEYTVVEVNPEFLWRHVDIDAANGTVSLPLSTDILDSGNDTNTVDSINIILRVRERHNNQTSDNMTLTFNMIYPTLPTTIPTTTTHLTTTTFDLTTETTSDLTSTDVTQFPSKTTTAIDRTHFNADTGYYKTEATALLIALISVGVIAMLVITAYIINKCKQQPGKRSSSYVMQPTSFEAKV